MFLIVIVLAFVSMITAREEGGFPKRYDGGTACHVKFNGDFVLWSLWLEMCPESQHMMRHHGYSNMPMTKSRASNTMMLLKSARNRFLK